MDASFAIDLTITDPAALHAAATLDYLDGDVEAGAAGRAAEFLGTTEEPRLDQCLRQLFDKTHSDAGIQVNDSFAAIGAPPLRVVPTVAVGTIHITREELARINAAFDLEPVGTTHRANEDICHDGLYASPKGFGFVFRVPEQERLDEILPDLTPEMRAIVELAVAQGAHRIEFDADEDPVDALEIQDHDA